MGSVLFACCSIEVQFFKNIQSTTFGVSYFWREKIRAKQGDKGDSGLEYFLNEMELQKKNIWKKLKSSGLNPGIFAGPIPTPAMWHILFFPPSALLCTIATDYHDSICLPLWGFL